MVDARGVGVFVRRDTAGPRVRQTRLASGEAMNDLCAVRDCRQPGTEDVDGDGTILCSGHADAEVWPEYVSEWCGKQE